MKKGALAHWAARGEITVHVTPGASRDALEEAGETLRIRTTAPPEGGRANAAVQRLLARALGVPKTALTLVRGATSRDKVFRLNR